MPFKKPEIQSLDSIHSMRVVDLREALRARNLSASGNKAALCERLYKAMQDDDANAKASPAVPHEEAPNSGMQSCGSKLVAKYLEEQKVALMKARKAADLARAASSSEMASEESKAVVEYEGKSDVSMTAATRGRRGKIQQKEETSADVESVKLTRVLRTRKSALTSTAVDCSGQETGVVVGEAAEKQMLELENLNQLVTSSEEKKAPDSKRHLQSCEKDQDEDVFVVEGKKSVDDQFENKSFVDEARKEQHFSLGSISEERERKHTEDNSICTEILSDSDVNLPAAAEKLTENVSVEVDQANRLSLSKDTTGRDEREQTNIIANDAIAENVVNRVKRLETSTKDDDSSGKHTSVENLQAISFAELPSSVDKKACLSPAVIESSSRPTTSPPTKRISVSAFAISVEDEVLDYGDDSFDDDHSHVTASAGAKEIKEKKSSKLTDSDNRELSSQYLESELPPVNSRNRKEVSKCIADPVSCAEERQRKSSICHLPDGEPLTNIVQKDKEMKSEVVRNQDLKQDESANKIPINSSWDADLISAINERRNVSPARRECSPVIYVRCLTRPYAIPALHNILGSFGSYSKKNFWINNIKSSCLVKYDNIESAVKARDALHNVRWPASNPKSLHVDFSTTEEVLFLLFFQFERSYCSLTGDRFGILVSNCGIRRGKVVGESNAIDRDNKHLHSGKKENYFAFLVVAAQKLAQLFQRTKTKPSLYYLPLTGEQAEMRIYERKKRRQFRLKAMEEDLKKATQVANKVVSREEKLSMVVGEQQSEIRNEGNEMSNTTMLMRIAMSDVASRRQGGFSSDRSPGYEIENWRRRPTLQSPTVAKEFRYEEGCHLSEDTMTESQKNAERLTLTKPAVAEGASEKSFRSENIVLKRRWSSGCSRSSSAGDACKRRAADGVGASETGGGRHQHSSRKAFSTSSPFTNSSSPTSHTYSSSLSSSATSSSSSSSRPSSSSVVSVSWASSSITSANSKKNGNRKHHPNKNKGSDRVKRSNKRDDSRERNSQLERAKKNNVVLRRSTHDNHRDRRFDEHESRFKRHDSQNCGPRER
ncbi:Apoptotic chromatin condensation inducer in the nucleus [Trichinella nelsoni]|uniref:Apoptotic chromatin condensation inducer in the nucleus n=1 Tax=Trichinella nelsoni TaxID=6336 RepID=A0A0V0S8W6_9BILA|nr:Apoptotic chromatin condensation inducer in the nucleus [Trichinella nelsoni]